MSSVIEFQHVGKQYRLGRVGTGTLSHDLNRFWQTKILRREDPYLRIGDSNDRSIRASSEYVWALRDIDFKVEQGEVLGIIGRNGAGKSTLLKLLSRITSPSTGRIEYEGRIASLLEVGTGFHPEMTGRENIYMNGSIMGMTRKEISSKLDAIVDFAGVEHYLDTPVKRYSSGMVVRLGFAVAAFLEPEILVVDEVLAVGDAEFQKKALGKMKDVSRGEGRTVLFVSHNMAAVKSICSRGIVLDNGMIYYDGDVFSAITKYTSTSQQLNANYIIDYVKVAPSFLSIDRIEVDSTPFSVMTLPSGADSIDILIQGSTSHPIICDVLFLIKTLDGIPLASFCEGHYKGALIHLNVGIFSIKRRIALPHYLSHGDYLVDICMHHPSVCWYFEARNCLQLHVEGTTDAFGHVLDSRTDGFFGLESIK